MAGRKKNTKSSEDIQAENELLKLKMLAEFGSNIVSAGDEIPPDLENQVLKNLMKFQKYLQNSSPCKIYDLIGKPQIIPAQELSDKALRKELKKLLTALRKNKVDLMVNYPISEREKYRFITEEMMDMEVEVLPMRGWVTYIVYDDYYPGENYEIREFVYNLVFAMVENSFDVSELNFSELVTDHTGKQVTSGVILDRIKRFKAQWKLSFVATLNMDITDYDNDTGMADVHVTFLHMAKRENGKRTVRRKMMMKFRMFKMPDDNQWKVVRIDAPWLK
ncbi:MAG: hypothetical protein NZM35_07335 [Chitinophagales bacterium]|nr:hypothetical protein [Chitinophagales bacterium]MDW8419056.1 hypothetical protein [Chitinophagales bacterium]